MNYILTKSKYVRGLQCERALYLDVYNPKLAYYPPEVLAKFRQGRTFEASFRSRFPQGKDISKILGWKMEKYPDLTREMLACQGEVVLFEAGFIYDEVLVLADVVHKHENGSIDVYEVKNGTAAKEVFQNDLSVQHYVLSHCLDRLDHFYLLYNDGNDGFVQEDFSRQAASQHNAIADNIKRFKDVLRSFEPEVAIDDHCSQPYDCPYRRYCERKAH